MQKQTRDAMQLSRELPQTAQNLAEIMKAEQLIAGMSDDDFDELRSQLEKHPRDGFLRLWSGLACSKRGRHADACLAFSEALKDIKSWRVAWYLAQSGKAVGKIELVDQACQIVLSENPDFWFAREFPKHVRGYYAQGTHDLVIEKFFQDQEPRNRLFVEVGAFDGVHYSNVRRLQEHYGWTGVSIEPVQKNFQKLCKSYAGTAVKCVQAAVGEDEEETEINVSTYPHLPDWGSDVASLSDGETARWGQYNPKWEKQKVSVKQLNTILDDAGVTDFDLLSIDAEGHDLSVLKSLDFSRFQPQLIVVEYGQNRQAILEFLASQRYSLILDNDQDLFFASFNHCAGNQKNNSLPATRNYTGQSNIPPYEEIQQDVENKLHELIYKPTTEVMNIIIVGGYIANEAESFLNNYPNTIIHIFEPSRRYFQTLQQRYAGISRVHCHNMAVSDTEGELQFHEGTLHGIGSLLPLKDTRTDETWIPDGAVQAESYPVKVIRLDNFAPLSGKTIDLLWCDVQGIEDKVLKGAKDLLKRCGSLFLEVATTKLTYEGQCRLSDLRSLLTESDFYLAGIGLCHSGNGTGNSFWLSTHKALDRTTCQELRDKLNPHMLKFVPLDTATEVALTDPSNLLTPKRFDVVAKYIYAISRELKINTNWAKMLYKHHLTAFNGLQESDGSGKVNLESYQKSFAETCHTIKNEGFNPDISLLPVDRNGVVLDGAHRLAACLLYGEQVNTVTFNYTANDYDFRFFQQRGLDQKWLDAMALEYCRLAPDTFVITVFPAAQGRGSEIQGILDELGTICYEKEVALDQNGAFNLIRQMYGGEKWLGTWENGYEGAAGKALPCFAAQGPTRVYLFVTDDFNNVIAAKTRIRELFNIGNHSVHINDTHEECIRLAQILFNENSIHFLNHAEMKNFSMFYQRLERYEKWMETTSIDRDYFCIDGSAVMAAYGIREARDLDFLHYGCDDIDTSMPDIDSHNTEVHHHVTTRDDIIFNPDNFFYFNGIKFASLEIIRQLKIKRGEEKDKVDVRLIDEHLAKTQITTDTQNSASHTHKSTQNRMKVVGLVPARNEAHCLEFCLRALSKFTDAIVYLDDCSEDNSVQIVESLASECGVERILQKDKWHRDEPGDRNALLLAGREIGGSHFIVIDADEALTSNFSEDDHLRKLLEQMNPGDQLSLNWIQLWRSVERYRFDNSVWTWNYKGVIFRDDGKCSYNSKFIHTPRVPENLSGTAYTLEGYDYGLIHFQFVNWRNLLVKQAWYRCLERIRDPQKPLNQINHLYRPSKDEQGIGLKDAPYKWFSAYPFFNPDMLDAPDTWREQQVLSWFQQYGREHFLDLDIWDIDWLPDSVLPGTSPQTQEISSLNTKGESLYEAGDLEGAREHFMQAYALDQNSPTTCNNLAVWYWQAGDADQALLYITHALSQNPHDRNMVVNSGQILAAGGHNAEAIQLYQAYLRNNPENQEIYALLDNLPESYSHDNTDSEALYAGADKPMLVSNTVPYKNESELVRYGEELFEAGNIAEARDAFLQILENNPDNITALNNLAVLHWNAGEGGEALLALGRAIALDPNDRHLTINAGQILAACDRIEDARNIYRSYLEDHPQDRDIREFLDRLSEETGSSPVGHQQAG